MEKAEEGGTEIAPNINSVPTGKNLTDEIYELIKNQEFTKVIQILNKQLSNTENARAVHSVLGYSYYQIANYRQATEMYEYLSNNFPEILEYKLYHAQSLHKAGKLDAAFRIAETIQKTHLEQKVTQLISSIYYSKNNLKKASEILKTVGTCDRNTLISEGCILFKENKFVEALSKFEDAKKLEGYNAELFYNIALCLFKSNKYDLSLEHVKIIAKKAMRLFQKSKLFEPEGGVSKEKVSHIVRETAYIEALNLQACIQYVLGDAEVAKESIKELSEFLTTNKIQYDTVTYHNEAIIFVNENVAESIKRLESLLECPTFPGEAFQNLIHLYCKYRFFDLASELLNKNPISASRLLETDEYLYVKALILEQTKPNEALKQYETIINNYKKQLEIVNKRLDELASKDVQTRIGDDEDLQNEMMNEDLKEIERLNQEKGYMRERLVAVLSNKAKIYWDNKQFAKAEEVFSANKEYCKGLNVFNLNVGHTLFMQEEKYDLAIHYYDLIIQKNTHDLNLVDAFVLANLCVCYIVTKQHDKAEKLMNTIKLHEEQAKANKPPGYSSFHYCSVMLVIGTLYCSKGNFEFGLKLIIKNLYPIEETLGTDTWHYVKRCFLSFIEHLTKKQIKITDPTFFEFILNFLDDVHTQGKNITTVLYSNSEGEKEKSTVAYEAAYFKRILLKLQNKIT